MAAILYRRVVGDLTVGKPQLKEFPHSATVREALEILIESNAFELPVWRVSRRQNADKNERTQAKEERFIGILSMLDIMGHLSSKESLCDPPRALNVMVVDIVTPNSVLLKHAASGTRLIDALDLIKFGTKQLLIPLSSGSQAVSRRFSAFYHSNRWSNIPDFDIIVSKPDKPSGYCCLTVEDVTRFLLGCLGALAPFPLKKIEDSPGVINTNPPVIRGSDAARYALEARDENIQAVAVVQHVEDSDGEFKAILVGEISAIKLRRCGFRVALAMATLTAADFVAYVEHYGQSGGVSEAGQLWSEEISLEAVNYHLQNQERCEPSSFPSRIVPLTCRPSNSVAAVMAQMLAYRTTHVWVTDNIGALLGIVTFKDIITAITSIPPSMEKLMASVIENNLDLMHTSEISRGTEPKVQPLQYCAYSDFPAEDAAYIDNLSTY